MNLSSNQTAHIESWSTRDYAYFISETVVGLLTIVVNSLVLAALYRYPILRTVTNCYIGSLAMGGIPVGLLVPLLMVVSHAGLPKNFYACVLVNCLVGVFTSITILSLICVAIDRYWAVLHPVPRLNAATKGRALRIVAASWTLGIFIGFVPLMGWHKDPKGFETCSFMRVMDLGYHVYLKFLGFKFPAILALLYVNVSIYSAFVKAQKQRAVRVILFHTVQVNIFNDSSRRSQMKLLKSLILIFVSFALCWLPIYILSCIRLWSPATHVNIDFLLFTVILSHVNSLINPILYTVNQPGFRKVFRQHIPVFFRDNTKISLEPEKSLWKSNITGNEK